MTPSTDPRVPGSPEEEGAHLRQLLLAWMEGGGGGPPGGEEHAAAGVGGEDRHFDSLALRVLRYQAEANPAYGRFLEMRGVDPSTAPDWRAFPPVPTRAFKEAPPVAGRGEPQAVFLTSGTTAGRETRGEHRVLDLSLYHASLLAQARAHLLPDREGIRVVAFLSPPALQPASSLSHMAGVLRDHWDDGGGGFLAEADGRLDLEGAAEVLGEAVADGAPVLLLTTAFGLVQWMDGSPAPLRLPPGSRVMETGGFKGRSREVGRRELYGEASRLLGLPQERIVNEYGMTELLSQFYEPVLTEGGPADPESRRLVAPPWVRTRILDPGDLSPVPPGAPGLLCHLDLANLFSAAAVLTEDLGVEVGDGFRVLGRTPGAEPRGCSLSMEAWLAAGGRGRRPPP